MRQQKRGKMKPIIIIPTYNEKDNIEILIENIFENLKNQNSHREGSAMGILFCGCKQSEPKQAKKLYAARIF